MVTTTTTTEEGAKTTKEEVAATTTASTIRTIGHLMATGQFSTLNGPNNIRFGDLLLLGPLPSTSQQGNLTMAYPQLTTDFAHAFNTMTLADPSSGDWYMDSGATSHMAANEGILKSSLNNRINQCVIVGNGSRILVISTGNTTLTSPTRSLSLNKVLITTNMYIMVNYVFCPHLRP